MAAGQRLTAQLKQLSDRRGVRSHRSVVELEGPRRIAVKMICRQDTASAA